MQSARASQPSMDPALVTGRLNVEDFVGARKEDIRVLEKLVASAGSKGKKRAFQSLPRTERRRAASHDAKRVPRKHGLRKRAELENLQGNAKKPISHARPRSPPQRAPIRDLAAFGSKAQLPPDGFGIRFADRQRDKVWLPTHIWHKKRAFLEKLGDFMVPVTATQKQYRRTHRLQANRDESGIMAWDTSFYATIIVEGGISSGRLDELLEQFMPGVTSKVYKAGSKHWQGLFNSIGPVIVHWVATYKFAVICHPLLFDAVWDLFANSAEPLNLQDARYAIGSIDLLGSSAMSVLADTLPLCPDSRNGAIASQWSSLAGTQSSNNLPSRFAFDFFASDPRLFGKRFKRHKVESSSIDYAEFSREKTMQARGAIYDASTRKACLAAQLSQSEIDHRKQSSVIFDHASDARIPVTVLILDDGRVRVLLPRSWVLPTWLTVFTRKRAMIGGQKELHQLAFERQCPFFPADFPRALGSLHVAQRPKLGRQKQIKQLSNPADFQYLNSEGDLYTARLEVVSRGTPESGERVYGVLSSSIEALKCSAANGESNLRPTSDENLLGLVTTGGFNLARAKGTGLALLKKPLPPYCSDYCLIQSANRQVLRLAKLSFITAIEAATIV